MTPDLSDIIEAILAAKTRPIPEARTIIRAIIARQPKPAEGEPHGK